jgi:hypothetical protein
MENRIWINIWRCIKNNGEITGIIFIILAIFCPFLAWFVFGLHTTIDLLSIFLGLISAGLGFVAIGMAAKLENDIANLPTLFRNDILTITGQQLAEQILVNQGKRKYKDITALLKLITEEQSKEAAQKRLDADTSQVGYVRGELFRQDDGNWAIHWGGDHPL